MGSWRMPASFGRRPLLAAIPAASVLASAAGAQGDPLKRREGTFKIKDFRFESGTVMPEVTIAYETYGTLAPDGRNGVLLTHGYTSGQHMSWTAYCESSTFTPVLASNFLMAA